MPRSHPLPPTTADRGPPPVPTRSNLVVGALAVVLVTAAALVFYLQRNRPPEEAAAPPATATPLAKIPVNGRRSLQYLQDVCALGPRPSGSDGMQKQQKMLEEHFSQLGGKVAYQRFEIRHPLDGSPVTLANMLVTWHPEKLDRVLLCCHYDTRPFPDEDPNPQRRRGVFVGANDGASGVALLCELAHYMRQLDTRFGVDFVLFDGEEFVFDGARDPYFLGSKHFAGQYASRRPAHRYQWGVLLDMVGDADLQIYQERNSLRYARPLVKSIWDTAAQLGVQEFQARARHEIRDDHLPLNQIAGIATCDLIDFDYPRPGHRQSYWHTEADTPDKCSAESLAKVGWVVLTWLRQLQ